MGSKPFRVIEQAPQAQALVGRGGDGKFKRLEAQTPQELRDEAAKRGIMVQQVAQEQKRPDMDTTAEPVAAATQGGDVVYQETIPWPPAGPINDANHVPFKLRG